MKKIVYFTSAILLTLLSCQSFKNFDGPLIILQEGELLKIKQDMSPGNPKNITENPLKGFVTFQGSDSTFPHSMEFFAFPISKIMINKNKFDFRYFDTQLEDIASRGNQVICRPYLDYPGEASGIPQFLIDEGLIVHEYSDHGGGMSPDYSNPDLVLAIENFISQWAQRYDGDPRLGFITMGILGHWGEWHTWPKAELFAPPSTQKRVIQAYSQSFTQTRLLLRIPHPYAEFTNIGFHDDSFAYSTLPPTDWHFWPQIVKAGLKDFWKTRPMGGEIRPDIQETLWKKPNNAPEEFEQAVQSTHASWLINQAVFEPGYNKWPKIAKNRALAGSRALGYQFYISQIQFNEIKKNDFQIKLSLENLGVAPFYYPWPFKLKINGPENILVIKSLDCDIRDFQPEKTSEISCNFQMDQPVKPGIYQIWIKIENPMTNGKPVLFLNQESRYQQKGWIPIYKFEIQKSLGNLKLNN